MSAFKAIACFSVAFGSLAVIWYSLTVLNGSYFILSSLLGGATFFGGMLYTLLFFMETVAIQFIDLPQDPEIVEIEDDMNPRGKWKQA